MITLDDDQLVFRFPDVHPDATCRIAFQRTLRIPDDNRDYPLPPGLGHFPLRHVDDHADRVPGDWREHGGVFLPMHQSEATWIGFDSAYPMAVKVAAGKIDALTGDGWKNALSGDPQDYLVVPEQPWLDGFCVRKGLIRQFVAMRLGEGYTAEEQLTGEARHGGLQIAVCPMKRSAWDALQCRRPAFHSAAEGAVCREAPGAADMGFAPGGLMRQEVYEDPHGLDAWDQSARSRCFVHVLNSVQFLHVTGAEPPHRPPDAAEYSAAGLPWFEYYAEDRRALDGARKLAGLDSVAQKSWKKGFRPENEPAFPKMVKTLTGGASVREGRF